MLGLLGTQTCRHLAVQRVARTLVLRGCTHRALRCSLFLKAPFLSAIVPCAPQYAREAQGQRTEGEGSPLQPYGGL